MAISISCTCGVVYDLKDEFAGRQVKCTACGSVLDVPQPVAAFAAPAGDPLFSLPRIYVKQKKLAINECYYLRDEQERLLAFAVRPIHFLRNLLAAAGCGGVLLIGLVIGVLLMTAAMNAKYDTVGGILLLLAVACSLVAGLALGIYLSPKRHLTFYRDEQKNGAFLEVLQDSKFQPITATYTVTTAQGEVLGHLQKNYLYNILRKRWLILSPSGDLIAMAKEDSIILSLLRRLLGPLFGILRINFIFVRGESDEVIGEFNRKLTLFDSYVLDMSADTAGVLDRRLALGLGVMLDTGERR